MNQPRLAAQNSYTLSRAFVCHLLTHKLRLGGNGGQCPPCPQKQTLYRSRGMSVKCQEQTSLPTKIADRHTPLRRAWLRNDKPSLFRLMDGNSPQQARPLEPAQRAANTG